MLTDFLPKDFGLPDQDDVKSTLVELARFLNYLPWRVEGSPDKVTHEFRIRCATRKIKETLGSRKLTKTDIVPLCSDLPIIVYRELKERLPKSALIELAICEDEVDPLCIRVTLLKEACGEVLHVFNEQKEDLKSRIMEKNEELLKACCALFLDDDILEDAALVVMGGFCITGQNAHVADMDGEICFRDFEAPVLKEPYQISAMADAIIEVISEEGRFDKTDFEYDYYASDEYGKSQIHVKYLPVLSIFTFDDEAEEDGDDDDDEPSETPQENMSNKRADPAFVGEWVDAPEEIASQNFKFAQCENRAFRIAGDDFDSFIEYFFEYLGGYNPRDRNHWKANVFLTTFAVFDDSEEWVYWPKNVVEKIPFINSDEKQDEKGGGDS